jgi:hypothetical protein
LHSAEQRRSPGLEDNFEQSLAAANLVDTGIIDYAGKRDWLADSDSGTVTTAV